MPEPAAPGQPPGHPDSLIGLGTLLRHVLDEMDAGIAGLL
jgi:hypothetical protein